MPNELQVDQFLKQLRESEEFGETSCSTVYECMEDEDIREQIRGVLIANPSATYEDVAKDFREMEEIFWSRVKDSEGW
jgi:hypothetical protein